MASGKRKRQRERRANDGAVLGTPIHTVRASVIESATGMCQRADVRGDLVPVDEAALRSDGTVPIRLISPGWGSSGFYSPEVLEAAGSDGVFGPGTHMYWDHPSATENQDRPERSLRDLAAVLETQGTWRIDHPDGPGIYAEARVFAPYREVLAEMASHIGVSIRAAAQVSTGEAEGRRGRIVESIVEAQSVDFVTRPGRGGQVLAILEAAGRAELSEARNVAEWFQSRIHLNFTTIADDMFGEGRLTKDERIALSNGIGEALDAFAQVVDDKAPQLLTRDLWDEPTPATPVTESQEDDMPLNDDDRAAIAEMISGAVAPITEALAGLAPPEPDSTEQLSEAETRAARAEEALLVRDARDHVTAALGKVQGLPAPTVTRLTEALATPATVPTTDDGKLDTAKLDEAIKTAVETEVTYLAEATGSPVRGVGGGDLPAGGNEGGTERLTESFQRLGLSEANAKVAAAGRGR